MTQTQGCSKSCPGDSNVQQSLGTTTLVSCYSKCGPGTNSTGITWELAGNAEAQAPPRPSKSESAA